jgi:hypothetical protein
MIAKQPSTFWAQIWDPVGDFRCRLSWRLIGFAMCQVTVGDRIWAQLAGAVLIVFGPRIVTLAAASASAVAVLASILVFPVSALVSPPEEFGVFTVLPLVAIGIALVGHRDASAGESAQLAMLRIAAVLLMFFAGFHKLNSDFFVESVSCTTFLSGRLDAVWAVPLADLGILPGPATVVFMELSAALLLMFAPRAGIAMTAAVLIPIALFGPTSFVTAVLALTAAGFGPNDGRVIASGVRKRWRLLALLWLCQGAAVAFLYESIAHARLLSFLLVVTTLLFGLGLSIAADWRGPSRAPLFDSSQPLRWVLIGFLVCWFVNMSCSACRDG